MLQLAHPKEIINIGYIEILPKHKVQKDTKLEKKWERERDEYVKVPKVKCDFINLLFDYIVTFSI